MELWPDISKLLISLVNGGDHEVPLRTTKKVFAIKNLCGESFAFPKEFFGPITEILKILVACNLSFAVLTDIVEMLPLIGEPGLAEEMMVHLYYTFIH